MHTPTIGTISHGTLRTPDLLEAFGWELQHISAAPGHQALAKEARKRSHYFTWNDLPDGEAVEETDADSELVNALIDALGELAPPYCYFGTHEGDGSDFGYWPDMEAIEELPRVGDPADVPAGGTGEDAVYVNDHGNVTVYGADGAVLLEIV
jgi:hypothetical protein